MAKHVSSSERIDFLNKLLLPTSSQQTYDLSNIPLPSDDIWDEIESLIEEISEQSEEEPDWDEYHDTEPYR